MCLFVAESGGWGWGVGGGVPERGRGKSERGWERLLKKSIQEKKQRERERWGRGKREHEEWADKSIANIRGLLQLCFACSCPM